LEPRNFTGRRQQDLSFKSAPTPSAGFNVTFEVGEVFSISFISRNSGFWSSQDRFISKRCLPQGLPHSRLKGKSQSWNGQNDDVFGHNYAFGAFVVAKRCRKGKIWEIPVRERSSCPKLRRLRQVAIGLQQGTSSTESLQ